MGDLVQLFPKREVSKTEREMIEFLSKESKDQEEELDELFAEFISMIDKIPEDSFTYIPFDSSSTFTICPCCCQQWPK